MVGVAITIDGAMDMLTVGILCSLFFSHRSSPLALPPLTSKCWLSGLSQALLSMSALTKDAWSHKKAPGRAHDLQWRDKP